MIDLRSDTVTRPTSQMLEAMLIARVGDDVLGDDPTVNALEEKCSALFGMEAAVFCPSGTMANQIALKAHTRPGDEVICDRSSHIYNYEGGGIALNSGCSVRLIDGDRGRFKAEDVRNNINNREDFHQPLTKTVAVENTSNRGGGSYYDFGELVRIGEVCKSEKLLFHLDGARLFNALTETDETPQQYGKLFDSISVCLSKGLGTPVGSVLIGDKEFINYARRFRKAFGGAMRQAGYLAAAGIFAIDNNIARLKEDHNRAGILKDLLHTLPYVDKILPVDTNIVIFTLNENLDTKRFLSELKKRDILMVEFCKQTIRAVTHLDITDNDLEAVKKVLPKLSL